MAKKIKVYVVLGEDRDCEYIHEGVFGTQEQADNRIKEISDDIGENSDYLLRVNVVEISK